MKKIVAVFSVFFFALAAQAGDEWQTREQLFAPIADPSLSPERRYAELDLNGDGRDDLVLSESVTLGGTGGLVYNIYLALGQDRYRQIDRFLAGIIATEIHHGTTRLWFYTHMSAGSGTVQYRYFDPKGTLQRSQVLLIYPGDGGSEIGNGIYTSIFNDRTKFKMKTWGPPIEGKPGNRDDD